ncbi:MAG: hypothetical protein BWY54_00860 [Candidatus Dependentiae bacterium ADurb.Bin331]|nr:MAG: hypothetical protein BWY54_00860 [Candidatus Dependentiae bacterium ADurb.Bin331]
MFVFKLIIPFLFFFSLHAIDDNLQKTIDTLVNKLNSIDSSAFTTINVKPFCTIPCEHSLCEFIHITQNQYPLPSVIEGYLHTQIRRSIMLINKMRRKYSW